MSEIEFIDDNHVKGEISEEAALQKVYAQVAGRNMKMYGRDTVVEKASFDRDYRGVPYIIKVLEYGRVIENEPVLRGGMNRIGKWAVVEYDKEKIGKLVEAIQVVDEYSEFLWHDTLHAGQEDLTLRGQVAVAEEWAHEDIDRFLAGGFGAKESEALETALKTIAEFRLKFHEVSP